MALFKKKAAPAPSKAAAGPATKPPPVVFVKFGGDADAQRLKEEFSIGHWQTTQEFLESLTDWNDRSFILRAVSDVESFPNEWVESTGGSSLALTARGEYQTQVAWRARGSGRATTVDEDGWRKFHQHLDLAVTDFQAAIEKDPSNPLPWSGLITTAMGLSLPKEEVLRYVKEADARHLGLGLTYQRATVALAQKWGGSHDLMFDFARQAARDFPDGHDVITCVATAHIEKFAYLRNFDGDGAQRGYFVGKEVADELVATSQRSVLNAHYVPYRGSHVPRSRVLFCLVYVCDGFPEQNKPTAQLFITLGANIDPYPWQLTYGNNSAGQNVANVRQITFNRAGNS